MSIDETKIYFSFFFILILVNLIYFSLFSIPRNDTIVFSKTKFPAVCSVYGSVDNKNRRKKPLSLLLNQHI